MGLFTLGTKMHLGVMLSHMDRSTGTRVNAAKMHAGKKQTV